MYSSCGLILENSVTPAKAWMPCLVHSACELTCRAGGGMRAHAGMQQRVRLKALDRFKANENAVLVASDVAAQGLDVTMSPLIVAVGEKL